LHLKNILLVPTTQKNLVSVHRLTSDNHTPLEYFPHYFLVKDLETKRVLLRGRCKDGLYPLPSSSHWRGALGAIKISPNRWHSRLGHPSPQIVQKLASTNKILCSSESVCNACQQAKSHQLPYPVSTSRSSKPFELVFSDVWGPAPESVGHQRYYVIFINDFSKFV
jgi:hypothetical protein